MEEEMKEVDRLTRVYYGLEAPRMGGTAPVPEAPEEGEENEENEQHCKSRVLCFIVRRLVQVSRRAHPIVLCVSYFTV